MKQSPNKKEGYFPRFNFNIQRLLFTVFPLIFSLVILSTFGQQTPWVAPKTADNVKNPLSADNSKIAEMKTLYVTNCGPCHGEKGRGDGTAAQGLNHKPSDHTSSLVQGETD